MKTLFLVLATVAIARANADFESIFGESLDVFKNASLLADNEDGKLTVPELIEKYGYPVETYNVTTEDGYILTIHRIPYGKQCGPGEGKRVIFLQHGLLCDSSNWIISGPEKGLAYNLADECYDVFMGNFRGNTYSKKHVSLHPLRNRKKFWAFSFDEMGLYDLPASIDFVLEKTGVQQIYYLGHSMGSTAFWILMSERPEYNSKIKLMTAFAPVAYTQHIKSPLRVLVAPLLNNFDWLIKLMGVHELLPSNKFMEFIGQTACHQKSLFKQVCSNVLFLLMGYDSEQLDRDILPSLMGHTPAGASVKCITHYTQGIPSKKFRKYDYGLIQNRRKYGSIYPPEYEVEKVTVPVALFWGAGDWMADRKDVEKLVERLPNVLLDYRVNHDRYNHIDFMIAKDNLELINRPVIEFLRNH